ncbi:MAG TPA: tol-pal system-associated acyl-CoA thioesterase [Ghiorsea sp.]|nr:tol-pal system-associated acyl-CoA thioesterase [Ghiorsea sp.]HIP08083.1 tol-pal system-associated acyl-CoA thioesterase [Mariprofundaceae bacterium]
MSADQMNAAKMDAIKVSSLDVRIYYEDTDAGGVVYHANYLKYMERGRTEALRDLGFEQRNLKQDEDMVFALTRTDIRYRRPAMLDDLLTVQSELMVAKGAKMVFKQSIYRGETLLVDADITLACINTSGRPKRIPKAILVRLEQEQ